MHLGLPNLPLSSVLRPPQKGCVPRRAEEGQTNPQGQALCSFHLHRPSAELQGARLGHSPNGPHVLCPAQVKVRGKGAALPSAH